MVGMELIESQVIVDNSTTGMSLIDKISNFTASK